MSQSTKDAHMLNLIDNLHLALKEYKHQVNKKIGTLENYPYNKEITGCLKQIESYLRLLKQGLISATPGDKPYVWEIYLPEIKATSQTLDQLVQAAYLPTRLGKIYEKIKTLLNTLTRLFAPSEGYQRIKQSTQTLKSTRSALFHQVKAMEETLNPPEKTEQLHYYRSIISPMPG